jgi:hypothetical protein
MKKVLLITLLFATTTSFSQVKTTLVKKVLSLTMPTPGEDGFPGTRGASIVWNPVQKKYYAAMAGNAAYPMGVYDAKGKLLSDIDAVTLMDVRGLWYNTKTKRIESNGYNEFGFFYYNLNKSGLISGYDMIKEGMNQPSDQSVGAYNAQKNEVLFIKGSKLVSYSAADATANDTEYIIHFNRTKKQGKSETEDLETLPVDYNTSTVIYTGIAGAEIGFLNVTLKQIELYNMKDGFMTQAIKLPKDAACYASFCFAYTNGMYWLFNQETRNWIGYK